MMIPFQESLYRNLFIDFALFSEAHEEYSRDQNNRFVENLKDLLYTLRTSDDRLDANVFKLTCMKLHPHLRALNNAWFNEMIFEVLNDDSDKLDPELCLKFIHTCEALINDLEITSSW